MLVDPFMNQFQVLLGSILNPFWLTHSFKKITIIRQTVAEKSVKQTDQLADPLTDPPTDTSTHPLTDPPTDSRIDPPTDRLGE